MNFQTLIENETAQAQLIQKLGITRNPRECGFILRDGSMVSNFPDVHDDRDIGETIHYGDSSIGSKNLRYNESENIQVMTSTGSIRCVYGEGFAVVYPPSRSQIAAILRVASQFGIDFYIDIIDAHGNSIAFQSFATIEPSDVIQFLANHFGAENLTEAKFFSSALMGLAAAGAAWSASGDDKAANVQTSSQSMSSLDSRLDRSTPVNATPVNLDWAKRFADDAKKDAKQTAKQDGGEKIVAKRNIGKAAEKKKEPTKQKNVKAPHLSRDPEMILALTIWGEARSHGRGGMRAVAHVIKNRALAKKPMFGRGIIGVSKKRKQFSCWNAGDPNRDKMENILKIDRDSLSWQRWVEARKIAKDVLSGKSKDPTGGALFYHTDNIMPYWAVGVKSIGSYANHVFYKTFKRKETPKVKKS